MRAARRGEDAERRGIIRAAPERTMDTAPLHERLRDLGRRMDELRGYL